MAQMDHAMAAVYVSATAAALTRSDWFILCRLPRSRNARIGMGDQAFRLCLESAHPLDRTSNHSAQADGDSLALENQSASAVQQNSARTQGPPHPDKPVPMTVCVPWAGACHAVRRPACVLRHRPPSFRPSVTPTPRFGTNVLLLTVRFTRAPDRRRPQTEALRPVPGT